MSYVIVSIVSLFIGCAVGVFALALCMASKTYYTDECNFV